VLAFRLYSAIVLARRDGHWKERALTRLRARFQADLGGVRRLVVSNPNSQEARAFLSELKPDLLLARCKFILKPEIFNTPARGTFVLHPGISPEYRNAHGCFWALVNRYHARVGMTLLKFDEGIDTGPVYLQSTCEIDEVPVAHRDPALAVLENLAIGRTSARSATGQAITPTKPRASLGHLGSADVRLPALEMEARRSRRCHWYPFSFMTCIAARLAKADSVRPVLIGKLSDGQLSCN
jgi:hypothetical protein